MFNEAARNKRSFHDYDEAENRLAKIIQTNVASDVIASVTNLVHSLDTVVQKRDQALDAIHRRNEDGRAEVCEQYKPERQRLAQQVEDVTEGIRQELLTDIGARELLEGFSRNPRTQLSAIRDAVHLIIGAGVAEVHIDLDDTVEEMAGAKV